jgi:hypothetical protein
MLAPSQGDLLKFRWGQFGLVARFRALHTVGKVLLVPGNCQRACFRQRQLGVIAEGRASSAIGNIALVLAGGHFGGLWLR